jgi:hypothetical protein
MLPTVTTVDQVVQALVTFEDAMTPDMPADMTQLSQARVLLARAVNSFVADEGEQINILKRIGITATSGHEQQELFARLTALRLDYSAHISRWTAREVAGNWSRYRADSITLIVAMRKILRARMVMRTAVAA